MKRLTEIDTHVGQKLKEARREAGFTQTQAGETINITFQQIQKYEKGVNRIGAGNLYTLSQVYGKPISWFFPEQQNRESKLDRALNTIIETARGAL